jgi:hypothetical protein
VMASSNKALKTMDGAAHGLYAYSKARTDVREWNRIDYSRATTTEKEERLKALRKAKVARPECRTPQYRASRSHCSDSYWKKPCTAQSLQS